MCTGNVAAWAVRRADDAYSVRAWLAEQPYVDAARIALGRRVPRTRDRLGYDAQATADARQQVIAFLSAHGLVRTPPR